MKLEDFLVGSGWTKEKVAFNLDLPLLEVLKWEDIPLEYLPLFQEWLFNLTVERYFNE